MYFKKVFEFSDHAGPIYSLTKFNDFVYSSSSDKWIAKWDLLNKKQDLFSIKLDYSAFSIFHCNQQPLIFIGCSNGDLHVIETDKKVEIKFIKHHKTAIFSFTEIPQKNLILSSDSNGNICVWDLSTFKLILQIPLNCGKIRHLNLSSNGEKILVSSKDGILRIIETTYFNLIHEIQINNSGTQASLETNLNVILAGYDGFLYVLNKESFELLKKIPAHKGAIYSIIPWNDNLFITGSRDKSIKIWNSTDFSVVEKKEFKSEGHKNSVNQLLKLSNDSFASCSDDGRIIIWQKEE